jgi:hypothetical protein
MASPPPLLLAVHLLANLQLIVGPGTDPKLPSSCTGKFIGSFADGPAAPGKYGKGKRVMPVVAPCGGADNPNPKACPVRDKPNLTTLL